MVQKYRSLAAVMILLNTIYIVSMMPVLAEIAPSDSSGQYDSFSYVGSASNITVPSKSSEIDQRSIQECKFLTTGSENDSKIASSAMSGALAPNEEWNMTFGGAWDDSSSSVQQTSDGGFIIAGHSCSYGSAANNVWLIKTDSSGKELWNNTISKGVSQGGYSVQQTSDGGYAVAGMIEHLDTNAWLIKANSTGVMLWDREFGGSSGDDFRSIQLTSDGGYVVTGRTFNYNAGFDNAWLIETDSNGQTTGGKEFGGPYSDYGESVQQTSDSGYIIAGETDSYGAGGNDAWLIKTDSNCNEVWNKTFGGPSQDYGRSAQQTSDGGYIIAGETSSYGAGTDAWLIKTDSSGNELWNETFGGTNADYGRSVLETNDGGYIIAGDTYSYGGGNCDAWLVKTDSAGNELWNETIGGLSDDRCVSIQQTSDGGYIISGYTKSYGAGGYDAWLIKVRPEESSINTPPNASSVPLGSDTGLAGTAYSYSTSATDPDGDQVKYTFDWGDGSTDTTNLVDSGTTASASHAWSNPGTYQIKAKATDSKGASSGWSLPLAVEISEPNNSIEIDESASDLWIDPYSSNANDKEAIIWYEIEHDDSSGQLEVEVKDSEGKRYKWDGGQAASGRHSLIWDGRVANEYVNQAKNPYYISLVLKENGQEVARSAPHRVWVGRPVILLHGIWSSKEKMETHKLYKDLKGQFYTKSVEYNGGIIKSSAGDIRRYAGKLNDEIDAIKLDTGAKKVDIVAHSMGGLVARWYVQQRNKNDVGKLIMIGTPNHGADLANLPKAALKSILEKYFAGDSILLEYNMDSLIDQIFSNSNVAIFELAPHSKFLQQLNGNDGCAYDIENGKAYDDKRSESCRYSVIISEHWFPTLTHMHLKINVFGSHDLDSFWATSGDGVVPRFSAKLSDVSIWFEDDSSHDRQVESQGIINQVISLLQQQDNLIQYRSSPHLEEKIGSDKIPVYWTDPIEETIDQGEVKFYNITIDPNSTKAHFLVVWDNGTLNAALFAPDGSEIEMQSEGNSAYCSVQSPEPGNWTAKISPLNIPLSGANLTVQAFIQNSLFIGVYTEKNHFDLLEPIKITAYLGNSESGFADALVKANISKPDGTTDTITLYDDGLHNDNQTADGIYSNEYTNSSSFGRYNIMVSASGSMDDYDFDRETFTTVWIEQYPDLIANSSMIKFSNDSPITGDNITITTEISNIGDSDASNASVLFYDNDPATGILIGEDVINIGPGESSLASIPWTATSGWHDIHVLISPFNEFMEDSYENNNASKLIIIDPIPTLNYPDFTDTNDQNSWRSWLVLQNPMEETANIEIELRSRAGAILYSGVTSIPAYSVSAIRPRNLAGSDCSGSAVIASSLPLTGTCQITRNSNEMCMGYNTMDEGSTVLYYPDFTDTANPDGWRSWLVIQNPAASPANLDIEIRSRAGDILYSGEQIIPANGVNAIRPRNLAGSDCAGSVFIESDLPVIGTCQITRNSNKMCMSYTASDHGSTALYYPDFTDTANPDGWRSWLVLQNPSDAPANLNYEIRSRAGDILYAGSDIIPAHGVNAVRPRNLAGADCSGSVVVNSDQPIVGTCQITRNSNQMCMSYNALDQSSTVLNYPDFTDTANPDGWRSWLVLQNPTAADASITLEIRSREGDLLYGGDQIIPAHRVNAIRPRNLVGSDCSGSVTVTSDQPIVGTCQITRNNNLMCMSYTAIA